MVAAYHDDAVERLGVHPRVASLGADFIYSAAEQECTDDHQPIAMLLQALAGGVATLAMYSTMWGKSRHRSPPAGPSFQVSLENGRRTIVTRDLRAYPMFAQPSHSGSRAAMWPPRWTSVMFGSPVLTTNRRVAVYFSEDNLWYPSTVVVASPTLITLRFDDSHWPDLDIQSVDAPQLLGLLTADESELAPGNAVMGTAVEAVCADRRTARVSHPPDRLLLTLAESSSSDSRLSTTSDDGLWLSLSDSGYQGVCRDRRDGSSDRPWRARIFHHGHWHSLGQFPTARAAAVAYAAARRVEDTSRTMTEADVPAHCVYRICHARGRVSWAARTYRLGRYRTIGTKFASRGDAVSAYLDSVLNCPAPEPSMSRAVVSTLAEEYCGVRLNLNPASATGYVNVRRHGNRYRACHLLQEGSGPTRVRKFLSLGTFATATEAAYAYACYVARDDD